MTRREAQKIVDKWFKLPGTMNTIDLVLMTEHYLTSKAGRTKSKAKSTASRENGKLGGRPKGRSNAGHSRYNPHDTKW